MKFEGPMVDTLVGEILKLAVSVNAVLSETAKLVKVLVEKKDLEFQVDHRRMPVTEEEIEKDITLSKKEIEIREREAIVRLLELQGREEMAKAMKAEAVMRQRLATVRQTPQKPAQVPGRPKPFPPLKELANKGESVVKESVRSSEGQLTHNLGDKLKSTQAS